LTETFKGQEFLERDRPGNLDPSPDQFQPQLNLSRRRRGAVMAPAVPESWFPSSRLKGDQIGRVEVRAIQLTEYLGAEFESEPLVDARPLRGPKSPYVATHQTG
jgi:hypothetical protein